VLDLCLIVVMCAFVIEICMISFPVAARFTVGWYAGRIFRSGLRQPGPVDVVVRDLTTL